MSSKPSRGTLRRALRLTGVRPWQVIASVSFGTLALGSAVSLGAVSAWMIARASQMPLPHALAIASVAVRTFGIGRGVMRYVERIASHDLAFRGMTQLRTVVYAKLAEGSSEAVLRVRRGDLLARVGADVDAVGDLVVRGLIPMGVAITLGVGTSVGIGILWPPAGVALAIGLLVAGWVAPVLTLLTVRRAEERASAARAQMAAVSLGILDDAGPMVVSGRTEQELAALREADQEIARAVDSSASPAAFAQGLGLLAQGLVVVAALVTGIPAVRNGLLSPTELAVIVLTPLAAFEASTALPAAAVQVQRSRAAAARILSLLDSAEVQPAAAPSTVKPAVEPAAAETSAQILAAGQDAALGLQAQGLTCGWSGFDPVLRNVDLQLAPGRSVAVTGPSGAGKTTLLLTLAGLLPARAGQITLNAVPLSELDRQDVVTQVVATTEDAHIFGTTVLENIRVARGDLTADEALSALKKVGLDEWVESLPDGLDTVVGPDARTVSGGERRRLLLARALASKAPLLLLDEPGEHLDPTTADRLLNDLLTPDAARGVLVVSHRVSPLAAADEVLWVVDGEIQARGSHQKLLDEVPAYFEALAREKELDEEA